MMTSMAPSNTDIPEWHRFELLVHAIQSQIAPDAIVTHNVRLPGRLTGAQRQVDVLVAGSVGQFPVNIAIDCKDHSNPVDVNAVESFAGLIQDTGVHKGVMVASNGFTQNAKARAKADQIDLYRPIDTGNHKWRPKSVRMPMLCDFRGVAMQLTFSCSAPVPLRVPEDFLTTLDIYDKAHVPIGKALPTAMARWDAGEYPSEPGEHVVPIFSQPTILMDNGFGQLVNVELTVRLFVRQELFLGHIPIVEIKAFRDEHTGHVITNAFTTGALDPETVFKEWTRVAPNQPLPFNPVLRVSGLLCMSIN